jgi:lantibiotic transport system ATP-binding protein
MRLALHPDSIGAALPKGRTEPGHRDLIAARNCAENTSVYSPNMPEPVIRTQDLSKAFDGKAAVRGVNLDVEPGSVYAFLGPNGAGKSTCIRMLLGLLRPTAGRVTLFGMALTTHRGRILSRTGSLVESPSCYPHLTARENLEISRRILDAPKSDIDRVLRMVGLQNTTGQLVKTFSLGMKQRLGLAQAMLGERELLILDEPTNGLDPAGISEVRSLIRQLPGEHGMTVFLSSHLLGEVEQVATHVGMLSQGQLVFQGAVSALAALRRPRLRIRVDNVPAARALLTAQGWESTAAEDSVLTDATPGAAAINRLLMEAGHAVHHMAVESATLEEVFLGMTDAEVL